MTYKIILIVLSATILTMCKSTQTSETKTTSNTTVSQTKSDMAKKEQEANTKPDKQGVIYFKEGENKFLKEYEMNVTFKRMVEDSRCPKDVECIWPGNAIAEVEFMGIYTRPVTKQLSTMNDANKGYSNTEKFNGYSITLTEVTPETTSEKGFKSLKGSYRIALQFEKDNGSNSPTERGGTTTK